MIYVLLCFWLLSALLLVHVRQARALLIYLAIFSLISSVCFLVLGSPDIAIAEAAVSIFSTIFFIVCFEKHNYLTPEEYAAEQGKKKNTLIVLLSAVFSLFLFALFIYFMPDDEGITFLKGLYLENFASDVGGENTVTAIYLGYRVYDTLFEALILLLAVVGVAHMSRQPHSIFTGERHNRVGADDIITVNVIRIACPAMLVFGIYLAFNGHLTPGGGFQGGVAVATFFICRYIIFDIHDVRTETMILIEKFVYVAIVLWAVSFVFIGVQNIYPQFQDMYLMLMNILIGAKVTFGFIIILFRYVAIERK